MEIKKLKYIIKRYLELKFLKMNIQIPFLFENAAEEDIQYNEISYITYFLTGLTITS